jgi:hypothetical protein
VVGQERGVHRRRRVGGPGELERGLEVPGASTVHRADHRLGEREVEQELELVAAGRAVVLGDVVGGRPHLADQDRVRLDPAHLGGELLEEGVRLGRA